MMYNILDVMSCLDMVPKGLNIQICPHFRHLGHFGTCTQIG